MSRRNTNNPEGNNFLNLYNEGLFIKEGFKRIQSRLNRSYSECDSTT